MTTPDRPRLVLGLSVAALVLASCGVETGSSSAAGPSDVTTTTIDCSDTEGEGGGTGGTVGSGDVDPACIDGPTPTTDPGPDPEPTTTTEPGVDVAGYEDALITSLTDSEDLGLPIDAAEAACIGPSWVEAIGAENMADLGLDPEDLVDGDMSAEFEELIDRPAAEAMVAAFADCGINVQEALVADIAEESGLTAEQTACFADELPDGFVEEILTISLADGSEALDGDPSLAEPITDAVLACQ